MLGLVSDLLSPHAAEALNVEFCLKRVGRQWERERPVLVQEEVTKVQSSSSVLWDSQWFWGRTTGLNPGHQAIQAGQ